VEEILRDHPAVDVNWGNEVQWTPLHIASANGHARIVDILLAHPDTDVNRLNKSRDPPFSLACSANRISVVRVLLKDARVEVEIPGRLEFSSLWCTASSGYLEIIRWWIASGREMDLGQPGNWKTDAAGEARRQGKTEVVTLLERFKENPAETRHFVRVELGWYDEMAAAVFAPMVFVSDGLLQVKDASTPAARFITIATKLPLELQMVLCHRLVGSAKEIISTNESEAAFKDLVKRL